MSDPARLGTLIRDARRNAIISWVLIAFVAVVSAGSAGTGDILWASFAIVVGILAVLPAVAYRDAHMMLPWEILLITILPLIGREFTTVPLTNRFTTYLAVAGIALIIAVELHLFTSVLMTPSFAVLFIVVTTMATAGIWAVARWVVDLTFGTAFLLTPGVSEPVIEHRLMWEFVWSTVAGFLAGGIFEGYVRRVRLADRLPDEIEVTRP